MTVLQNKSKDIKESFVSSTMFCNVLTLIKYCNKKIKQNKVLDSAVLNIDLNSIGHQ